MAILTRLDFQNFRHFDQFSLRAPPGLTIISGPNASGKTSLLEAIYLLAHGKSFRTTYVDTIIKHDVTMLTLFATGESIEDFTMGYQKQRQQKVRLKVNQEPVKSIRYLTQHLPLQLMTTQSARYFTDGPKLRRDFLAWGLFYTQPTFYHHWQQYQRALSQRNRDLKKCYISDTLGCWDTLLVEHGEAIDQLYQAYIQQLAEPLKTLLDDFLPGISLQLSYTRGWDASLSLTAALEQSIDKSLMVGYTTVGVHRCDLRMLCDGVEAQDCLSRGQLKLASYALSIAQGILLNRLTGQCPIYLIDDLTAELDQWKQKSVLQALGALDAQVFLTMIDASGIDALEQANHIQLG